ncbi:hypothetical protein [Pseudoalteromonas sp. SWN166]|uniref:hypothetical protein n=1 Tax=Pseudoalteromonas sp. SWN166 TaxID=2792061 RepID=UPI0018CD98F9|nr:hypothetical protein [Pseudoalteromonas sp. SWN166]MBH0039785.1 hypothetical protein [Pseudoalteromonas sp. SWN166]
MNNSKELNLGYSFTTLGIWRKIYLWFMWIITILISGAILKLSSDSEAGIAAVIVALSAVIGFMYWAHWAISKRKVGHITVLAVLNLIVGGNIIGCIIMFFIRHTTVKEMENS